MKFPLGEEEVKFLRSAQDSKVISKIFQGSETVTFNEGLSCTHEESRNIGAELEKIGFVKLTRKGLEWHFYKEVLTEVYEITPEGEWYLQEQELSLFKDQQYASRHAEEFLKIFNEITEDWLKKNGYL